MSTEKSPKVSPWISVEDAPLFTMNQDGEWEVTEAGEGQFLAALEYVDIKGDGGRQWWIRHCVVMDIVGLCVISEDDVEPAGWELNDVEYYIPISSPVEKKVVDIEEAMADLRGQIAGGTESWAGKDADEHVNEIRGNDSGWIDVVDGGPRPGFYEDVWIAVGVKDDDEYLVIIGHFDSKSGFWFDDQNRKMAKVLAYKPVITPKYPH
jgi:hypothetical protein